MNRYGHLMSFRVKGGAAAARRVFDALQRIWRATDLGRVKSVATIPAISTHQQQGEEGRALADIPPNLIRLCVGGEHPDDIIADLTQALAGRGGSETVDACRRLLDRRRLRAAGQEGERSHDSATTARTAASPRSTWPTRCCTGRPATRGSSCRGRSRASRPACSPRARDLSYPELAAAVLGALHRGRLHPRRAAASSAHDAYDFEVPLERIDGPRHVMRLDRGPTASFKDFAARFMGRALGRLVRERGRELLILTATSGDTGSAIAHAFLGVEGIRVVVLFPIHEVSDRQRRQMTTLGGNVATLALDSKFDNCQALVKQAFSDPDLADLGLTSANSINIGRLLPQSVYYLYAASRLADVAGGEKVIFSVPSGNFGDLMGGLLALHMGLPVERFVVATNANDEVPRFLETGRYAKIEPVAQVHLATP